MNEQRQVCKRQTPSLKRDESAGDSSWKNVQGDDIRNVGFGQ